MKSKNAKIITFLTVFLLAIMFTGVVTATEIENTDDTLSVDNTNVADIQVNEQAAANTNVVKTFEDTKNITKEAQKTIDKNTDTTASKGLPASIKYAGEDTATYAQVKDLIENNDIASELIITLNEGVTYEITAPIVIDSKENTKTVTINGNSSTITGLDTQSFITVSQGYTLDIQNVTIKNTYSATNGGAIKNYGTLNVENVTFDHNIAVKKGGAIYSEGTVDVKDSTFTNNQVTEGKNGPDDGGAAIFAKNTLTVSDSKFESNVAKYTDDSSSSDGGNGGAIQVLDSTGDFIVTNCEFLNNAGRHGGAIMILDNQFRDQGTRSVTGSTFKGNKATYGGAIKSHASITIKDSVFEENEVDGFGNSGTNSPSGGAVLLMGQTHVITSKIENCNFTKNVAHNTYSNDAGQGSAVYTYSENAQIEIKNCEFKENKAYTGGTIYVRKLANDLTVKDSIFTDNTITTNSPTVSPLGTITTSNVEINGLTIDNIDADGTIYVSAADYAALVNIVNTVKTTQMKDNITVTLTGTTYEETETIALDDTFLPESFTIDGNGQTIDARQSQFLTINAGKKVAITNLTIENAQSDKGAAITNHGTLTVTDSTFDNNEATDFGGAIYSDANLTVIGSTFSNNIMSTKEAFNKRLGGAAITSLGNLTVDKSVFTNNEAKHKDEEPNGNGGYAGAIYILNTTDDVSITNSNFTANQARHGGAICVYDMGIRDEGTVTIDGNNFNGNFALYGGAINALRSVNITNNNFTENYVSGEGSPSGGVPRRSMGGALCLQTEEHETHVITSNVINNNFIRNEAKVNGQGGAIKAQKDTTLYSEGNTYDGNKGATSGAVQYTGKWVDTQGTATFTNDVFKNNVATDEVGAINAEGPVTIDTCTFENNDGIEAQVIKTNTDATIVNSEITGNLLVEKVNDAKVEAFDTTINGVKVDYTSFDDEYWFNVANYGELVQLVEKTKDWGMEDIIANLTGTDYTWTESIVIENSYKPNGFIIYGNGQTIDADGHQFITNYKNLGLSNVTVKNAKADKGAAIINYQLLVIYNSSFEDNEALYYGGAIYSEGLAHFENTDFKNNKVTTSTGAFDNKYGGGAITSLGALDVWNCTFEANEAAHVDQEPNGDGGYGGAILILNSTGEAQIYDSNFTDNNNARHGGVICILDQELRNEGEIFIRGNNFKDNTALYGVIDAYQSANITNNNFTNNVVSGQGSNNQVPTGGALVLQVETGETHAVEFLVENNIFDGNEAVDGTAGAITTQPGTTTTSKNNVFKNNKANQAGAVQNEGNITFDSDQFIGNTANYVGAIANFNNINSINNCTFTDNKELVGTSTGDILWTNTSVSITKSTINTDNLENAIAVRKEAKITATDNTVNGVHLDTDLVSTKVTVTIENDEMFVGEENAITCTLIDATDVGVFNKTVTVYVGGTEAGSYKTGVNGVFTIYYTPTGNVGSDITVQAKFEPATDDYYIGNTSEEKTVRIKSKTSIVVDQFTTNPYVNNEVTVTGTLIDSSSNGIQGKTVDVYVNGVLNGTTTDVTDADGKFTYKFTPDTIGDYNISAKFNGDDSYGVSESANVTLKVVSYAHINIVPPEVGMLGSDVTITGNLTDDLGNVITGKNITVTRVGAGVDPYNVTTDETTGIFTVTFSPTKVGTNTIILDFTADEYYTPSTMTETSVTVRSTTNITLDEITEDYLLNDTMEIVVTGKITDALGRGISNAQVLILVDGTSGYLIDASSAAGEEGNFSYTFTTADINKAGQHTIIAVYNMLGGNYIPSDSNPIFVNVYDKPSLTIESTTTPLDLGDQIVVTGKLSDYSGAGIGGESITVYLNGQAIDAAIVTSNEAGKEGTFEYTTTSNKVGELTYNASYEGTGYYCSTETTQNVIVEVYSNTNLTVDEITQAIKVSESFAVTGKLTDTAGNGVVGEVEIYVGSDKKATATTSADGTFTASLTIDNVGTYTISAIYRGDTYYRENLTSNTVQVTIKSPTYVECEVINDVEGKVVLDIRVFDAVTDDQISNAKVDITGDITATDVKTNRLYKNTEITNGECTITVTYNGKDYYEGNSTVFTFNVTKDPAIVNEELQEQIDALNQSMNQTIEDLQAQLDEANEKIANLTQNVTDLENNVTALEGNLTEAQDKIADLENNVTSLEGNLTEAQGKIDDLNNTVQEQAGQISDMNATINDQAAQIDALNDTVKDQADQIAGLEGNLTEAQGKIDDLNNTVQEQAGQISDMNNTIKDQAGQISDMNATINDQAGQIGVLNDTVKDQAGQIADMNSTINDQAAQIGALNDTVKDQAGQIAALNDTANAQADQITALNDTVKDQAAQISDLENNVTDLIKALDDANDKITDMNGTINDQADQIDALNDTVKDQAGQISDLENNVTDLQDEINEITKVINTSITVNSIADVQLNDKVTVKGTLTDADGNKLMNTYVTVSVNGVEAFVKTDNKGVYTYTATAKKIGENVVTATYEGTEKYNASTTETTFNVEKGECTITIDDITQAKYGENVTITGTFKNAAGKGIANSNVRLEVNGVVVYAKTNHNGVFTFTTIANKTGENTVVASYGGSQNYNSYNTSTTFTVEKQNLNITVDSATYADGEFTITGTFKDVTGKALANSKVRVNVNGKIGYAVTNHDGLFNYTAEVAASTITYAVGYGGNANYNAFSGTKTTITVA